MSRATYKIKGLKYPSADKITGRISTLRRSMACTLMHRDACTQEQEDEWSKFFGDSTCAYCGRPATHLDHLHPMIRDNEPTGYGTDPNNLVPCCEKCNRSKGNMDWEDFMQSENCGHTVKSNKNLQKSKDERIQTIKDFQAAMQAIPQRLDPTMKQQWKDQWNALEQELKKTEDMLLDMKRQLYGNSVSVNPASVVTPKSGSSRASKHLTDEFAEFKAFVGNRNSANTHVCNIRKIMNEMGVDSLGDLAHCVDAAIDHCNQKRTAANNGNEKKRYSKCCAALRKYKEYLETLKAKP